MTQHFGNAFLKQSQGSGTGLRTPTGAKPPGHHPAEHKPASAKHPAHPPTERKLAFTKIFRWRLPHGHANEPATVEVAGTFTDWKKVPLIYDPAMRSWQVTLHHLQGNRTHHYMLLADGKPVQDAHSDGLAIPNGAQEMPFAIETARGPRVFMLFSQTK